MEVYIERWEGTYKTREVYRKVRKYIERWEGTYKAMER